MMVEDFDEETLEDIRYPQEDVIGPIAEMRRKKEIEQNTMTISRENYENSTDMQVEAWFTKFDQVIIDDSKNPYRDPLTKKELAFKIIDKFSIENLNKGITKFNNGVNLFSKMVGSNSKPNKTKFGISKREYNSIIGNKRKGNTRNFWEEDRKTRKKRNKNKSKETDYSFITGKRKVRFF